MDEFNEFYESIKNIEDDGEQLIRSIRAGYGYQYIRTYGQYFDAKEWMDVILCYINAIEDVKDKSLEEKINHNVANALGEWWK